MPGLPPTFVQTIENTFGEDGQRWLASFPALLENVIRRWNLTDVRPVPNLSYNFVAFANRLPSLLGKGVGGSPAQRGEGEVVLKLGVPHRELTSEIAALRLYNGRGICQLLEADPEKGMMLLERLAPGHMLATLMDDERATRIAAEGMEKLWNSGSRLHAYEVEFATAEFILLEEWFDGFQRLRQRFNGGTGLLPEKIVEKAESLARDLLSENKDETLLHGDFHHYNVLESARGWLAIDPKGVIGPRGYEVGPFLMNPVDRFLNEGDPKVQTERRIAVLSENLGMERERIRCWALCHAILSAWWCIEGNDPLGVAYSLRCADIFNQVIV